MQDRVLESTIFSSLFGQNSIGTMFVSVVYLNWVDIGVPAFECYAQHFYEMPPASTWRFFAIIVFGASCLLHPKIAGAYPSGYKPSSGRLEERCGRQSSYCPIRRLSWESHGDRRRAGV